MNKFNEPKKTLEERIVDHPTRKLNFEGGLAFEPTPLNKLYLQAATCLVKEPKFYQTKEDSHATFEKTVADAIAIDPEYVLKLAVYCREKLFLRSVPLFLVNEVAYQKKEPIMLGFKYITRVIQRADELTELIALAISRRDTEKGKTKVPQMIKKGVAAAFNKFDTYQFGKYKKMDKAVSIRDALFIAHPTPKDEAQGKIFDMIADATLPIPETWETKISVEGSTKENWESIIPKMGYMALMRNLRNFIKVDIGPEAVFKVCSTLSNPVAVRRSRQLPFRFLSAYKVLRSTMSMSDTRWGRATFNPVPAGDMGTTALFAKAVEKAMDLSVHNLPTIPGNTVIAMDTSASMTSTVSGKSVVRHIDIATLMGTIAAYVFPDSQTWVFGESIRKIDMPVPDVHNPRILTNCGAFLTPSGDSLVGHSTNGYKVIQHLLDNQESVDRIVILSDEQLYDSQSGYGFSRDLAPIFAKYRQYVNPKTVLYSVDLAGYGDLLVPEGTKNAHALAGWTNSIFRLMEALEVNPDAIKNEIESIRA